MSPSRPVPAPPKWLSELTHSGGSYILIALGLVGAITELASTLFLPRLALYLMVLAAGGLGVIRSRRAERLATGAPAIAGSRAVAGVRP